mgnify:CR=1 FL=1
MAQYKIKEVLSRKDLKRFITFVDDLYRGCDLFVPPLHKGQEFDLMHSPSLEYCTRKMWLAEDESGKVVGRICAMINPRYNDKYDKKRVRFGWFDLINDIEVARLLINAAETWRTEWMKFTDRCSTIRLADKACWSRALTNWRRSHVYIIIHIMWTWSSSWDLRRNVIGFST